MHGTLSKSKRNEPLRFLNISLEKTELHIK